MKQRVVLFASVFIVLFAGVFLRTGPWAGTGVARSNSMKVYTSTAQEDPLSSAAGRHWRSGQPHHWRALLLQH
jgi:hypothetical protein